jgi:hypothetical protein
MLNGIGWLLVAANFLIGNYGVGAFLAVTLAITSTVD